MKKIVSIMLALFLTFSISSSALAKPIAKDFSKLYEKKLVSDISKLETDSRTSNIKDNDRVRVIVELNGNPAIDYATDQGVKVNQLANTTLDSITSNLNREQQTIKNQILSSRINIQYHNSFTNIANGFSATVTYGDAKRIERMPGVSRVSIANEYQLPTPDMTTSKDDISAIETWNLGYLGEGMIISIIDSGIDHTHRDMKLSDPLKAKLNSTAVSRIIATGKLKGKWYTDKVPYGYNYYDHNDIIIDLGGTDAHGMHVAGISAANGDEGGVKGVAPEAQLLAMKVFSNDPNFPSTYSDIYLAAIEDSIKLGADVINMSLGSTASFVRPNDPEQVALAKATRNGLVLAMSAGNSGNIGYGWGFSSTSNPDVGVVGSPGLNTNSIQVASVQKSKAETAVLNYKNGIVGYMPTGPANPITTFSGPVEYVNCKLGLIGVSKGVPIDDFAGVNLNGKIAFIQRGGYDGISGNFVDKIMNAQNHGAIGVIVYNSLAGGDGLMSMAYPDGTGTIPAVFIGLNDGLRLKALIASNENKVEFKGEVANLPNPDAGKLVDSSSWGSTPSLDFKPELTAPGANIYSTFNNNTHGYMSGTSMAAPHVAGGSSLILQRVDKEFKLKGFERSLMAKNLLLSTATPLKDLSQYNKGLNLNNYYSPRRQGAGVMNLYGAATTPTIITEKSTGISKAALMEIGNITNFTLKVTNFSNEQVDYNLSGTVATDLADEGELLNEAQSVYSPAGKYPINFSKNGSSISSITIPAKGSTEFNVAIDLTNAVTQFKEPINEIFPNGTFIEGFIRLNPTSDSIPSIGLPYMGYYGKWDKAPVIDDTNYEKDRNQFYGSLTGLFWTNSKGTYYHGQTYQGEFDETTLAFSPNGDTMADNAKFFGTFLRNAQAVEINILDKNEKLLRAIAKNIDIKKNYYNGGSSGTSKYRTYDDWEWDGIINNQLAQDGEYIFEVKARVDYPNAQWQTIHFPIRLDNTAPVIEDATFDPVQKQLVTKAKDNHAIQYYMLFKNDQSLEENETGIFDLAKYIEAGKINTFTILAIDYAYNAAEYTKEINTTNDATLPTVYVDSPEVLGVYATNKILVKGYVTDDIGVKELKVNEELIPLTFNSTKKQYEFNTILTFDKAINNLHFIAKDTSGNVNSINRKIFIDTKAPEINAEIPEYVDFNVDKLNLSGLVTENMPSLKVYVNSSIACNIEGEWLYIEDEAPVTYDLSQYMVELAVGDNTIVIEAKDDAGNHSVKEYHVVRKAEADIPVEITSATVTPDRNIFATNPATITGTTNVAADWEVTIVDYRGVTVKTYTLNNSTTFNDTWAPTAEIAKYEKFTVMFKVTKGSKTDTASVSVRTKAQRR